jgi:hypothetical protein
MSHCPNCGSPSVRVAGPRSTLERVLSAFIVACECQECQRRFHVTKWHKPDSAGAREPAGVSGQRRDRLTPLTLQTTFAIGEK